jgi:hypothetical protein
MMYHVIFNDRSKGKKELCISSKKFKDLDKARAYAKTVCSSRKPRVVQVISLEPQLCGYCGADVDKGGWYSSCCGGC